MQRLDVPGAVDAAVLLPPAELLLLPLHPPPPPPLAPSYRTDQPDGLCVHHGDYSTHTGRLKKTV